MKRILFVDDESNILDGIRRMLRADRDRWDMHFAIGGEEAIRACDAAPFDLVISDMRMPGIDGATLLTYVRDHSPETARIILSGYSETAMLAKASHVAYCILGKPCKSDELRATIERVCTMQDLFNKPELRRVIGSIGELPSLSRTYQELSRAIRDPESTIPHVAAIIEQDVAMSAKVLQLINSGFFGLANTIANLNSAVAYLGLETIKSLALSADVFQAFLPASLALRRSYERVQTHSTRTSTIAATLPLNPKSRDIAVVAALLQDIGELVLASRMPGELNRIETLALERNCPRIEVEQEVLGVSHAEIGAYLLGLWGINSAVVEAVANHHHPIRIPHVGFDGAAAVYLADLLANELDKNPLDAAGETLNPIDRQNLEKLGLLADYPAMRSLAQKTLQNKGHSAAPNPQP